MPAKVNEIQAIANEYEIPLIEDAAEALGSRINGVPCGNFGMMSVFSFNGNKIITTSGGGALLSQDQAYIKKARFLATQARDAAPHYQHSQIGFNYRLSNVCAGIGRGQMQVLEQRVQQRRANLTFYKEIFANVPGITFQEESAGSYSNYWLTAILIDLAQAGFSAESLRLALEKENIESRPLWKPMFMKYFVGWEFNFFFCETFV